MTRFTRYFLGMQLRIFAAALFLFSFVMVSVVVVNEAIRSGLPMRMVPELIPYAVVQVSPVTIPISLLLAITTVCSDFSGSGEFTAMKALGVSPMAFVWPTLMIAILLSFISVRVNDLAVSHGLTGIQRVVHNAIEEVIYETLRVNRRYDDGNFSIAVHNVRGKILDQVRIVMDVQGKKVTVRADEATIQRVESSVNGETRPFFRVSARNVLIRDDAGEFNAQVQDHFSYDLPLPAIRRRPWDTSLAQIPREIGIREQRIHDLKEEIAAVHAFRLLSGEMGGTECATQERLFQENVDATKREINRLRTESWRRWASGFSCLSYAWIGMALALSSWMRASEFWVCFGICFVPILLLYFPIFLGTMNLAKIGVLPPYFLWCGNLVLMLVGLVLFRPVNQY